MAPIDLKIDNFVETVQDSEIVLVDFWAAWCGPCQRFAPIFEAASERHPNVTFAKVDTEDQQDLAGGLDIQAIPTLMAFKQGQLVYREAGLMNGSQLDSLIEQIVALDLEAAAAQDDKE